MLDKNNWSVDFSALNRVYCPFGAISRMSPSHLLWQGSHTNDEDIKVMGSIGLSDENFRISNLH